MIEPFIFKKYWSIRCQLQWDDADSGDIFPLIRSRILRATSHMRLRARDHYTSNTFIGGNGGAGPSLLHTTLEGPMEYRNTIAKIRFASQKLNFSIFVFLAKKSIRMILNSLEVTKCCKKLIYSIFCLQSFIILTFLCLFLNFFLDELAMVLRYVNARWM